MNPPISTRFTRILFTQSSPNAQAKGLGVDSRCRDRGSEGIDLYTVDGDLAVKLIEKINIVRVGGDLLFQGLLLPYTLVLGKLLFSIWYNVMYVSVAIQMPLESLQTWHKGNSPPLFILSILYSEVPFSYDKCKWFTGRIWDGKEGGSWVVANAKCKNSAVAGWGGSVVVTPSM